MATLPMTTLKAHGTAVGLPSDADMGNSEVGHNAMGCGRVFEQGAKLVSAAKVTVAKAFDFIGKQSIQLHGGIGLTDEYEL